MNKKELEIALRVLATGKRFEQDKFYCPECDKAFWSNSKNTYYRHLKTKKHKQSIRNIYEMLAFLKASGLLDEFNGKCVGQFHDQQKTQVCRDIEDTIIERWELEAKISNDKASSNKEAI